MIFQLSVAINYLYIRNEKRALKKDMRFSMIIISGHSRAFLRWSAVNTFMLLLININSGTHVRFVHVCYAQIISCSSGVINYLCIGNRCFKKEMCASE